MVEFTSYVAPRVGLWRSAQFFLFGAFILCLAGGAVEAASTRTSPASGQPGAAAGAVGTPSTSSAIDQNSPSGAPLAVDGFRSARFGMDEAALRSAIETDFGIKGHGVKVEKNPVERTTALVVSVPNLLSGGGTADVSYVLGYKTKKLIQVGISWNRATDKKMTPDELYADGEVLKNHFLATGYAPASIKSGLVLRNGILLFRGEDKAGHATILLLQGTFSEKDGKKQLKPESLALLYAVDPNHPDIFKISPGKF